MAVIALKCPHLQINVVDINKKRIESWNDKDLINLPIYEPGLEEIILKCRGKNLHFSNDIEKNIAKADMIFISVNTPTKTEGHGAGQAIDLKWVDASARKISEFATGETIVVEKVHYLLKQLKLLKKSRIFKYKINKKFHVLSNPNF